MELFSFFTCTVLNCKKKKKKKKKNYHRQRTRKAITLFNNVIANQKGIMP